MGKKGIHPLLLVAFYGVILYVVGFAIFSMFRTSKGILKGGGDIVTLSIGDTYSILDNIDNKVFQGILILDNDGIVKEEANVLTALKEGLAIISIITNKGHVELKVTVAGSDIVNVTDVSLSTKNVSLNVGEGYQLSTTVLPDNATNKSISYSSSKENIASVSGNGYITAKEEGSTNITVYGADGKKDTCTVTVKKIQTNTTVDVTDIKISNAPTTLNTGRSVQLVGSVEPSSATNKSISWSSSNTSIATVKDGYVLALREGTVIITATSSNGKTASVIITIKASNQNNDNTPTTIDVTGVTVTPTSGTIYVNGGVQLSSSINPSNATNKNITWTSSNTSVATVNNGYVKGVKAGTAVITVTSNNGKSASATITVKANDQVPIIPPNVDVTGVSIYGSASLIYVGNTLQLSATVSPSNAANKNITWKSSNTAIATIDSSGKVTALKNGIVTLTATSNNGKYATYKLQINEKRVIFIGASNIARFDKYSISGYGDYKLSNNKLFFIFDGGTKVSWQLSESSGGGGAKLMNNLAKYSTISTYGVDCNTYYLIFSPPGNDLVDISGEANIISNAVSTAKRYNDFVAKLKGKGYNITTYLMSKPPLEVSYSSSDKIVGSSSSNALKSGYRSPVKYETFDKQLKQEISSKYSSNLIFLDYYTYFTTGPGGSTYKTSDGIHYNKATTKAIFEYMMKQIFG